VLENVEPKQQFNFQKFTWKVMKTFDIPYDYRSIMHYGTHVSYLFSNMCDFKEPGDGLEIKTLTSAHDGNSDFACFHRSFSRCASNGN
jgi:hypothetical protein